MQFYVRSAICRRASAFAIAIAAIARGKKQSVCAWTESITVRIAAKRAKFMSWKIMTNDSTRVVFRLDPDPRLVGVLLSAIQFQALQAGLSTETCTGIAQAFEDVCRESISHLPEAAGPLDVTLDTFEDRIEVSIHHHPKAPVAAEQFDSLELLPRVDRVLFNTERGARRTTLVKFLHHAK